MSRDIRSYFMGGGKTASKPNVESVAARKPVKNVILDSSDEEDNKKHVKSADNKSSSSSEKKKRTPHSTKSVSKRRIESDDEEEMVTKKHNPKKKTNLGKLNEPVKKVVDINDLLGSSTIARVPKKKDESKEKQNDISILLDSDEDLEMSMVECEIKSHNNINAGSKITIDPDQSTKPSESHTTSPKKTPEKVERIEEKLTKPDLVKPQTPTNSSLKQNETKKRPRSVSTTTKFNESTAEDDEDRHDKKRLAAILYQKFKNRSSVINPGSKELPKGRPNCLLGKTFVITGILESLEREEAEKLIHEYGGKVVKSISKKTNYVVVGEEAGPAKLGKADDMGIPQISEDDLFEIINKTLRAKDEPSPKKTKVETPKTNQNIVPQKLKKESPKDDEIPSFTVVKKHTDVKPINKEKSPKKIKVEINDTVPKIASTSPIKDNSHLPWVEKYKPTSCSQIIGQQGPTSNVNLLKNWLQKWHSNHDGTKKLQKPNPWKKNDDGSYFKAALLSGSPGIGKTTTVNLVCKELGFDMVEFNASDTRSKKLLKEEVSELLNNQSLYGYFHGDEKASGKNHVLVMDEVDGMAGNEDRGGIQELISLIKDSSTPIICMCNDRNHQKMRSLVNYCFDLRFHKPRVEQIKAPIMSILYKENFKVPANVLSEIIASTNNDIRQTLNYLSLLSSKKDLDDNKPNADSTKKDLKLGPWDVVRKVFSFDEHKKMSIYDKSDLFFHDYSIGPLFVQQNYLSVAPKCAKSEVLGRVAQTADILSLGDLVDRRIRSSNAWSLLPVQAMFSSVLPGEYMSGNFTGQINFPAWLGKNSKTTKRNRLAQEVHDHTRTKTSASVLSFRHDYAPILIKNIAKPLVSRGLDGVAEAIEIIKEYRFLREDIDSLIELTAWPGRKSPFDAVDSKVKAALTRTYNKEICPYSYSATAAIKKKNIDKIDDLEYDENEEPYLDSDDEKDDEDLNNDVLIKKKKLATASSKKGTTSDSTTSKASSSKASSSKVATSKKPKKK